MAIVRILLLVLLGANRIDAAEPVSVDRLIEQLGSKSFAERERASQALIERGPSVLSRLRQSLASNDEEVRRRAENLIPRLEIAEALLPRRISIQLENQPLADAIPQLEKQTGYRFVRKPAVPGEAGKRTIQCRDVPFWEALDRLDSESERILCSGTAQRNLNRESAPSPYVKYHGPFRLAVSGVHEDRDILFNRKDRDGARHRMLTVSIDVIAEPRIQVTKLAPAKIDEAIDSDGKSLLEPKTSLNSPQRYRGTYRGESLEFSDVRLRRAGESAKSIKVLKGSVPIKAIVLRKPMAIKLLESAGRTVDGDGLKVEILQVAGLGMNSVQVRIKVTDETTSGVEWIERFKVQDDAGNVFQLGGYSSSSEGRVTNLILNFEPRPNTKAGSPTKLIFEQWIAHEFAIPFEFRDILLP